MRALVFNFSIPRWIVAKALGTVHPSAFHGRFSLLGYREIPEPSLPGGDWVKVRVRLGGICGSDLDVIHLHSDPRQAVSPFASFPFVVGHENVGTIVETGPAVAGLAIGERVTVEPVLPCIARGLSELCAYCVAGQYNLCLRFADGHLQPGLMLGVCASTGGSWGEVFVAHRSQVFSVSDGVSDENALMAEPMATTLHAMIKSPPADAATVLVIGGGVIGSCTIAALRAMGSTARIIALVKYPFQGDMARGLGADQVVFLGRGDAHYDAIADLTGGKLLRPLLGKRVLMGGADFTVECVGRSRSIDDALRLTKAGGRVVILGQAALPSGVDWTSMWLKELHVTGSVFYAFEHWQGRRVKTMEIILDWMRQGRLDLSPLVTHRFPLRDYARALRTASGKANSRACKVAFQP